jgi:hypothetical protein
MHGWQIVVTRWLRRLASLRTSLISTLQAIRTLLDVARIAAHESGQRINAPLLCYLVHLVGRADRGADLEALAEVVRANQPA